MAVVVLCLLLLLQFPLISASRLLGHHEACGIYRVDYSDDLNRLVFYVNGILVEKDLFCNALKFDRAEHCVIPNVGFRHCGLDLLIGMHQYMLQCCFQMSFQGSSRTFFIRNHLIFLYLS